MKLVVSRLTAALFLAAALTAGVSTAANSMKSDLMISEVFVDNANARIVISGEGFEAGPGPLRVMLGDPDLIPPGACALQAPIASPQIIICDFSAAGLPGEGDYLLVVSNLRNGKSDKSGKSQKSGKSGKSDKSQKHGKGGEDEYDLTIGAVGPQGDQGEQGKLGPQGDQGAQGKLGAQGDQGAQGKLGAQGDQGAQGKLGPSGPRGSTGARGSQGSQGKIGPQGPAGLRGFWQSIGTQSCPRNSTCTYTRGCPVNHTAVSGMCGDNGSAGNVRLIYTGRDPSQPRAWRCRVRNEHLTASRTINLGIYCVPN